MRWFIDKMLFYGCFMPGPVVAVLTLLRVFNPSFGYPFAVFLFVLFLKGFGQVAYNRRAVVEVFGYKHNVAEAGLRWKFPFFGRFILFPTTKVELEHPMQANTDGTRGFGVITKREAMPDGGRVIAPANLGVETAFQFEYPKGDSLIVIAETFPAPKIVPIMVPIMKHDGWWNLDVPVGEKRVGEKFEFDDLSNLLEEPIGDAVRDLGAQKNYILLQQQRGQFGADIHRVLTTSIPGKPDSVIKQLMIDEAGMPPSTIKLTIKHINVPEDLKQAFRAEEIAELTLAGTIRTAEGTRITEHEKRKGIAMGWGEQYTASGAVTFEEKRIIQAMMTQSEMALGSANTVFVPTDVFSVLRGSGAGSGSGATTMNIADVLSLLSAATPAQRAQIASLLGITLPSAP